MRHLVAWAARAGTGFGRACAVAAVTMTVPAIWAGAVVLGLWWGSPWSAIPLVPWACIGTFVAARPASRAARHLIARWTGTVIPAGYRQPGPITRMATGHWWNGFTYAATERRARQEQEWHVRWRDPANLRDLRFALLAPVTAGLPACVPPLTAAAAVLGAARPGLTAHLAAAAALAAAAVTAPHAWRPFTASATRLLHPTPAMTLAGRVDELTAQRADLTLAQADEIRRIERDLHDGAQARLVTLGISLATAERLLDTDPDQARALLRDARGGASASLAELRELVQGISPPVLTERGLVDAVRLLALDLPLDVTVTADVRHRPAAPVESAVYFGVAELLTNTVKHAGASTAHVTLAHDGTALVAEVHDDGRGGADPAGGLTGLRRRLAALDGTLRITSPPGGPTDVRITVPCASS